MTTSLKPADALISEKCRALHAIWKRVAGERLAPARSEITLGHVRRLSPWLWTIDVVDQGADFRFRLGGDRIVQFLGQRHSGRLLSQLPTNPFFSRMQHTLSHCIAHKKPVARGPLASGYPGKEHCEMEVVVLPLSEDGHSINCVMGAMELWPVGAGPRAVAGDSIS